MNRNSFFLSGLVLAGLGSSLAAQQVDVVYLERYASYHQQSASTIVPSQMYDDYLWVTAGAEISSGSLSDLAISNGLVTLELPPAEANVYEGEESFGSVAELNLALQPVEYTISGTGSTEGDFELKFTLPVTQFFAAKKVTNYAALQNINAGEAVTIEWEAFTEAVGETGFVELSVEYWDGTQAVVVWESPDQQEGALPGLPPSATSVTIPAGVLQGSPNGVYTMFVWFGKFDNFIENPGPFDGGTLATLVSVETHLDITVAASSQTETWADWSDSDVDNWINTQGFLGWIYVGQSGWIAPQDLGWIYLPEEQVTADGAWSFVPRQ